MLLAAPGYLLGQLFVGSRIAGLERMVVMTGLALAVPVLGGLLLYAVRVPLHRPGWLGLLAGVTLDAWTLTWLAGSADRLTARAPGLATDLLRHALDSAEPAGDVTGPR